MYADDDPIDETDALGLGGICDVPLFGGAACAVGALAHGAYNLIAGSISTPYGAEKREDSAIALLSPPQKAATSRYYHKAYFRCGN